MGGLWLDLNEPANFKEINSDDDNLNLKCYFKPTAEFR